MNFDLDWLFEGFVAACKIVGVPLYMYGWFKVTMVLFGIGLAVVNGWNSR